ncbi:MAG: beta-galactosidase [bacterium]
MNYDPIFHPRVNTILHGADYNPDQWLHMPEVIDEDFRLMKLAKCSIMNIGIFAWAALEPQEGTFCFEWLDNIMDRLSAAGMYACLATPSGARPRWLATRYPETNRVREDRTLELPGTRHNHNYSSPVMREKVGIINTKLAERYAQHPALLIWHISNEYGGEDHSDFSQQAFREWLKVRYDHDLDALNRAWWTSFWSRTYQDWEQILSPAPHGERAVHGLVLDCKRFVTHQTVDFMRHEIEPLKRITPEIPVTTNFMENYPGLDYFRFADFIDVASWDSYPRWHTPAERPGQAPGDGIAGDSPGHTAAGGSDGGSGAAADLRDYERAADVAFMHDLVRSVKGGKPFMLMESTPSMTNWQQVGKRKEPGMHTLSSMHAVAHGADTIEYFQWRKSRGAWEKFHGAVVDHVGHEHTRVFGEVAELGNLLESVSEVAGSRVPARVAVVYDWENRWAIETARGPRNDGRTAHLETVITHYRQLWKMNIPTDVIDQTVSVNDYRVVIAPMAYMLKPGFAERIDAFVRDGGTFVATYWSGIVDETDLCFLGGFPGPLRTTLGIWSEEIDALPSGETRSCAFETGNTLSLEGGFTVCELCDRVHTEGAEVQARYRNGMYRNFPAITRNRHGEGEAWYLAARHAERDLAAFYNALAVHTGIPRTLGTAVPAGVAVGLRENAENRYFFLQNFTRDAQTIVLPEARRFVELSRGEPCDSTQTLQAYATLVLKEKRF